MKMKKEILERVEKIYFSDIKTGQFITLENDPNSYVVVQKGQSYMLIPIDLKRCKRVGIYDVVKPTITNVFSAKTGVGIKTIKRG